MSQNQASEYQIPQDVYNPDEYLKYDSLELFDIEEKTDDNELLQQRFAINDIYQDIKNDYEKPIDRDVTAELHAFVSEATLSIVKNIEEARKYKLDTEFFAYEKSSFFENITRMLLSNDLTRKNTKPLNEEYLLRKEGEIGGELFDKKPNEHFRFFIKDGDSWLYQEVEKNGIISNSTIHYLRQPTGIYKMSDKTGAKCQLVEGQELIDYVVANHRYHDLVMKNIYGRQIDVIATRDRISSIVDRIESVYDNNNSTDKIAA